MSFPHDEFDDEPGAWALWWPPPLLAISVACAVASMALLVGAGRVLAHADIGGLAVQPACRASAAGGLVLVLVSGLAAGAALLAADARAGLHFILDPVRAAVTLPLPLILTILGWPPLMGCSWAGRLAHIPLLGGTLVGGPGDAVTAVATWALGMALASAVRAGAMASPEGSQLTDV